MSSNPVTASSAAGSIYDLGYRHYEGQRRGVPWAMWSLYVESLRGIWGFGRPVSAKAPPFILAGMYSFAALIQLAFSSFISAAIKSGESSVADLFSYGNYFSRLGFFIILFCIAQAPEVVCRDQRYQVLPLYFTRTMTRAQYALSRLASLVTALFIFLMVPLVALFIGDILMQPNTFGAVGDELPKALPSVPANLVIALGFGAISLALCSFSPRRAYAAIGLLAYFLLVEAIPATIYGVGREAGWTWADKLTLIMPSTGMSRASDWFFGLRPGLEFPSTLGSGDYLLATLVIVVFFTGILLLRYRRISA